MTTVSGAMSAIADTLGAQEARSAISLKSAFDDESLNVMNFLNEVVSRFPDAISFAPGRPAEGYFDVEGSLAEIPRFVAYRAEKRGVSREAVYRELGQYGITNGVIQDLICQQLANDEGITADPASVVVTTGCQEGMAILLLALFDPATDVLLSSDPTYIGITGLARILGIEVEPIDMGEQGLEPAAVSAALRAVRARGKRARALYDVPDFNNPMGTSMPLSARRELLALAQAEGFLIFEDNPYGMFAYDEEPAPTLKSLDRAGVVIYLGSYSKTLFPSLRVGFLVAEQDVERPDGSNTTLAFELSKVKSLTTVNTPPLLQAVVGGTLLVEGGSLRALVARKLPFYRDNRDRMLAALERELLGTGATWNRPGGGFFLTVTLPFDFTDEHLTRAARDFGVIVCPLPFFSLRTGRERQIRLSFSYVTPEAIDLGVARLARFLREARP